MIEKIENDFLKIEVSSKGAELKSVFSKKNEREYLWQGSSDSWPRQSPVLFPIVGKLRNNQFKDKNKRFSLNQHGFARDKEFSLKNKNNDTIVFELKYSEESLMIFPYKFKMEISYVLINNKLTVKFNVINIDSQDIYFSIGAHPGFNCPLFENERFSDYYLEFEKNESLNTHLTEGGLFTGQENSLLKEEKVINLSEELFKNDALVLKEMRSSFLFLKSRKSDYLLKFNLGNFPFLGIWTKQGAPFVCIEPWQGIGDNLYFEGDLKDKEGIVRLEKEENFETSYSIEII